jgi:hypothetical protein
MTIHDLSVFLKGLSIGFVLVAAVVYFVFVRGRR